VGVSVALLGAALAFAAVTLYALEGREIVVVRTRAPDGSARETRTWVADDGNGVLIEAAFEARPFFQDLLITPEVELVRGARVQRYRATPVPNPGGHARIRALLAEKYGWADWWVGLLQDTSQSVAVRLAPVG
jgi:hypothetical protein